MSTRLLERRRGWRVFEITKVIHDRTVDAWKAYVGTRNFALLQAALEKLREITDPFAQTPQSGTHIGH